MIKKILPEYKEPVKLAKLAHDLKHKNKFPNFRNSFEYPSKDIDLILEFLLDAEYNRLNFFDVSKLLTALKEHQLDEKIDNELMFTRSLQKLFNHSNKSIQNLMLRVIAKIFIQGHNIFLDSLNNNLNSKEFVFLKYCVNRDLSAIEKTMKNQNLERTLKFYGLDKIFTELEDKYAQYLLLNLRSKESRLLNFNYTNNKSSKAHQAPNNPLL